MPNTSSAKRALRKSATKRLNNRSTRSNLRTDVKKFRVATEGDDKALTESAFRQAVKKIDQAEAKGLMHKNKAARTKSRLSKLIKK